MISVEFVQEKLQKLKDAVTGKKKIIVLTHDNPDPDSISCAVTLSAVITQVFNVPCTARYSGIVCRAENREMIRALGLDIKTLSKKDIKSADGFALVDCQPQTGNISCPR